MIGGSFSPERKSILRYCSLPWVASPSPTFLLLFSSAFSAFFCFFLLFFFSAFSTFLLRFSDTAPSPGWQAHHLLFFYFSSLLLTFLSRETWQGWKVAKEAMSGIWYFHPTLPWEGLWDSMFISTFKRSMRPSVPTSSAFPSRWKPLDLIPAWRALRKMWVKAGVLKYNFCFLSFWCDTPGHHKLPI